jgi:hypothetical protein
MGMNLLVFDRPDVATVPMAQILNTMDAEAGSPRRWR